MAETFIHIYADVKGDWRPSSMRDATDHADGPGHSTMNAESIRHLVDVFTHLKKRGTKVDRLDFHTHGAPGHLAIGADFLGFQELSDNFKNRGFEKIFKKNARVFFHGCNVADRADGEMFLAVFGAIFLREGAVESARAPRTGLRRRSGLSREKFCISQVVRCTRT